MADPMPTIVRSDARVLPLPDASVDLIVTSPPYWSLRAYQDGGTAYDGQIGAESTPQEFIRALVECTREWMRVLKPSGSLFVNLGDKYATRYSSVRGGGRAGLNGDDGTRSRSGQNRTGTPEKSLMLLPERYRIAAVDDLGLIARAVIVWSKPNGLPESVTDRVRRSHEDWVHLTRSPKYFAAVDEIREPHAPNTLRPGKAGATAMRARNTSAPRTATGTYDTPNLLGKVPGSVWEIATQPLKVPAALGVDHFAAFPMEWPRRLILGWSPREVCTVCGEGRRPVTVKGEHQQAGHGGSYAATPYGEGRPRSETGHHGEGSSSLRTIAERTITGYACACPDTGAASTPGVVLDPFGGTGTTALVATMLGRRGISVDLSADYCRLAQWRAADPKQRERAGQAAKVKAKQPVPELELIDLSAAPVAVVDPVLVAIEAAGSPVELAEVVRGVDPATWSSEYTAAATARFAELSEVAA